MDLHELDSDEAFMNVTSHAFSAIQISSKTTECHQCPYSDYVTLYPNHSLIIKFSTKHQIDWILNLDDGKKIRPLCEISTSSDLGEFGIFNLECEDNSCSFTAKSEGFNIYLPLYYWSFVFLAIGVGHRLIKKNLNWFSHPETNNDSDSERVKYRTKSIDVFRGIALCFMIFVNNGGGHYWFFEHSTWDGLLPADLLFPWFLFIMGFCISLSQKSLFNRNTMKSDILKSTLIRSCKLLLLGLFLNSCGLCESVHLDKLRVPGVLQRIAISYLVVSVIACSFPPNLRPDEYSLVNLTKKVSPQIVVHLVVVFTYWALSSFLPVPNCPRGYLGPGGIQFNGTFYNCTGGAAGYIDNIILGKNHLYQHHPVRTYYKSPVFDPENILGCLTSIFQTFLGFYAGCILAYSSSFKERIRDWLICGCICLLLAVVSVWLLKIPINKSLWSISFALVTTGLGYFIFCGCYVLVDVIKMWSGAPFLYPGMNSIAIYAGHMVFWQMLPFHWRLPMLKTHSTYLLEDIWVVAMWIAISYWLYKKKIFVSL